MQYKSLRFTKIVFASLAIVMSCSQKKENATSRTDLNTELVISSGNYRADIGSSNLTWIGRKISSGHDGTIDLKSGILEIGNDGSIYGKFDIDMTSISVSDLQGGGKNSLERHLKNEDFFDVIKFPTASIEFKSNMKNISENKLSVVSDLTIKNITHPLEFNAQIFETSPKLKINADMVFDRSIYDVRYGSGKFFENLGDRLILDEVQVGATLIFN